MNPSSHPRQPKLLLESLEARILYSAAPVGFFEMDSAPSSVDASHDTPPVTVASSEESVQPLQPVSIENALNQVGAQIKPWGLVDEDDASSQISPDADTPAAARFVYTAGAPEGETYFLNLEEAAGRPVSGPDEEMILHSEPDTETLFFESHPESETTVEVSGEDVAFSLIASSPPSRLVFTAA
mgnify:CR=1 FL=1|tara:strand:- start:2744 stop:3295 length:552 start_codon:yes stop_codon:yes gene_type:complete